MCSYCWTMSSEYLLNLIFNNNYLISWSIRYASKVAYRVPSHQRIQSFSKITLPFPINSCVQKFIIFNFFTINQIDMLLMIIAKKFGIVDSWGRKHVKIGLIFYLKTGDSRLVCYDYFSLLIKALWKYWWVFNNP